DFRSDFLSRPTQAMRDAMADAGVTPSAFGLREDPFVQRLEERAARLLGKEDALFCPTCTQANQIAINLSIHPGQAVAAIADAHIFTSEAGAVAALSGGVVLPVAGEHGVMDDSALAAALVPGDSLRPSVGLVVEENTHVRSGGRVIRETALRDHARSAERHGIPVHIDGARLPNASIALDVPMQQLARHSSSVSLSLNKGLGAPLGAILAGSAAFIQEAEVVRQRLGGGWRPAGMIAAAALTALDAWEPRITADHRRAQGMVNALHNAEGVLVEPQQVQSNLILAAVRNIGADELVHELEGAGVLALKFGPAHIRLAIHADIDDDATNRAIDAMTGIAKTVALRV
ncbi:MAG: hypothetical protein HOI95_29135, partial [Chromatiales bacterium]|nr:hypothetical protein [Chromatiales bacterium]